METDITTVLIGVGDSDRLARFGMQQGLGDSATALAKLLDLADTLAPRVEAIRQHFRAREGLPDWTPEQWLAAVSIQLGQAAESLHAQLYRDRKLSGLDPADKANGIEHLLAIAAICMDAVEALEGQGGGEDV